MFQLLILFLCICEFFAVESDFEFGKKLPCEAFLILNMYGLQQCFSECKTYPMCLSINYDHKHLVCKLNSKRKDNYLLLENKDNFIYKEITDQVSHYQCGNINCDSVSKCVQTTGTGGFVCIPTACSEPVPEAENGIVVNRTYMPPAVTVLCNPGYVSKGNKSVLHCIPGKGWGTTRHSCFPDCPGPWEQYEGRQYCFVSTRNSTWDHAKLIHSRTALIPDNATPFWVGLTDDGSEGVLPWYGNEPSGGTFENCVLLSPYNTWEDYPCSDLFPFICEK